MNANQLREHIINPVLKGLDPFIPYSEEAVDLLLMTSAHESHMGRFLHQVNGPAQGIYQMEPDTEDDIHYNFLRYRSDLQDKVLDLVLVRDEGVSQLIGNLYYATAMARVHYWRVPEALPKKDSTSVYYENLAKYAKKYYNTELGKATWQDYYNDYMRFI